MLRSRPRLRCVAAAALAACMACSATASAAKGAATVYGRVDLNLTRTQGTGWQMTQASTSRIGLRGSEPLGSGVNVQFQLEARIDADTGSAESRFWGRESWLGLQGDFGRLRLGRSLSPSQRLASSHDPHGTDGIGSFGSGGLLLGHSALVRLGNAVFVETLSWHGLSASGALQLDEGGGPSARATSLRLRYAAGPIDASAASAAIGNGGRVTSFGATWDLGVLRPMAQWHRGRRDGIERRSALVGATLALPAGVVRLAVSQQHERATGEQRRQTLVALGYDHALSRRTQLYGTVAQQRVSNRSPAGRIGLEAGLRHSF